MRSWLSARRRADHHRWGAKRAEYGHPEPYTVNYVEIGNEDFFSCTYPYRFPYLYSNLKQAYPNIRFFSTAFRENKNGDYQHKCKWTVDLPSGSGDDVHYYQVSMRVDLRGRG